MSKCVIPNCCSTPENCKLSFFNLPFDPELLQKWLNAIQSVNENFTFSVNNKGAVCSKHFLLRDFNLDAAATVLKSDAVPLVFSDYAKILPAIYNKHVKFPIKNDEDCNKGMKSATVVKEDNRDVQFSLNNVNEIYIKCEDVCRLCAQNNSHLINIFGDEGLEHNIPGKIKTYLPIPLSENDSFSQLICYQCISTLIAWHQIFQQAVNVNSAMKKELNASNELENFRKEEFEVIEVSVGFDDDEDIELHTEVDFEMREDSASNTIVVNCTESKDVNELIKICDNKINENSTELQPEPEKEKIAEKVFRKFDKSKIKKSTVCRICGKLYSNRSTYLYHLQKFHSVHNKMKKKKISKCKEEVQEICCFCGRIFRTKSSYQIHFQSRHLEQTSTSKPKILPRRMCELCGKIITGNSFSIHMKMHTKPPKIACEICDKLFVDEISLRGHMKDNHSNDKPFQCKICPNSYKRSTYLRSHVRYKHEGKPITMSTEPHYRCDYCGYRYKTFENLCKHLASYHDNDSGECNNTSKPSCEICGAVFQRKNYLQLHKKYVHDEKQPYQISENAIGPFKCDKCDERFASYNTRKYHYQKEHGCSYPSKINEKCDHCGLMFNNRVFFAKHQAKLQSEPTCYLCWDKFHTKDMLTKHINRDHGDDLPFMCEICQIRFLSLKQLNHHLRSKHLEIKPFKCDLCAHRTGRKDSLEMHIRSCHLKQKPHKCRICGRGFAQVRDCHKHEVIHTRNQ